MIVASQTQRAVHPNTDCDIFGACAATGSLRCRVVGPSSWVVVWAPKLLGLRRTTRQLTGGFTGFEAPCVSVLPAEPSKPRTIPVEERAALTRGKVSTQRSTLEPGRQVAPSRNSLPRQVPVARTRDTGWWQSVDKRPTKNSRMPIRFEAPESDVNCAFVRFDEHRSRGVHQIVGEVVHGGVEEVSRPARVPVKTPLELEVKLPLNGRSEPGPFKIHESPARLPGTIGCSRTRAVFARIATAVWHNVPDVQPVGAAESTGGERSRALLETLTGNHGVLVPSRSGVPRRAPS